MTRLFSAIGTVEEIEISSCNDNVVSCAMGSVGDWLGWKADRAPKASLVLECRQKVPRAVSLLKPFITKMNPAIINKSID